jgi:hypothetical protein
VATLKSLLTELLIFRKHLPKGKVSQQYVDEYNALLTATQDEIDIDLTRFFIRPNDGKRDVAGSSSNYLTGESSVWYSEWYCESNFFLLKLDSAISLIADKLGLDNPLID